MPPGLAEVRLEESEGEFLVRPFTEEEVKAAI